MGFKVNADLVPLFRELVTGLRPFAAAQEVLLVFTTRIPHVYAAYNPTEALSEITVLLNRIITFTPQSYTVAVTIGENTKQKDRCILSIENTGVDLSKLGEILSSVSMRLGVKNLEKGTRFIVTIPTTAHLTPSKKVHQNQTLLPKKYPRYFTEINKRLTIHFSNTEHLEKAATIRSASEGVFLKKLHAVIHARMGDPNFKVDGLANAMALSRTQLFRKLKTLTKMSPQQYLRFVRLETAKKLLRSTHQDLNVGEVCHKVGFASKSHFTRSFQQEFGFNPSEYRLIS